MKYIAHLKLKRNDPRTNNHNRLQLQHFRANCDLQIPLDIFGTLFYIAKYATKPEQKSEDLVNLCKDVLKNLPPDMPASDAARHCILKTIAHRDFSPQEIAQNNMGLPTNSTNLQFARFNLNYSKTFSLNLKNKQAPITKKICGHKPFS